MEFKCSVCDYSSALKTNVIRHINKKKKCGDNPDLIEVPIEIKCSGCDKKYSSFESLKRHAKNCQPFIKNITNNNINNIINNITNNNINNNNLNINIQINSYDKIDFSMVTDDQYYEALCRYLMAVPKLIEMVQANKDIPQNHSVFISRNDGKYVKVFNGKSWTLMDKDQIIQQLIYTYESKLESWVYQNRNRPEIADKFKKYLNIKNKDGAEDALIEYVKLALYNKNNIIRKTYNLTKNN